MLPDSSQSSKETKKGGILEPCSCAAKAVSKTMATPRQLLALRCPVRVHGFTVASILNNPRWSSMPRVLDMADLWGGEGACRAAARRRGLQAGIFDIAADPQCDFFAVEGFCKAVDLVMQVRPGGCVPMGPTCSSFGFGPTSKSGRKAGNFTGDVSQKFVAGGNYEAEVACLFLFLAVARDVHAWIEQPVGSMMFSFLAKSLELLPFLVSAYTPRCAFAPEPLGQRFLKRYKFVATGDWILNVAKDCPCGTFGHVRLMTTSADGTKKTGDVPAMKQSQVYPLALGVALVKAWQSATPCPGVRNPGFASTFLEPRATSPTSSCESPSPAGPWVAEIKDVELPERPQKLARVSPGPRQTGGPWDEAESCPDNPKCADGPWQGIGTLRAAKNSSSSASASPWFEVCISRGDHRGESRSSEVKVPGVPKFCSAALSPWN